MTENWYIVLELGLDPPVEDEREIEAKIEEKRKRWAKDSTKPLGGDKFKGLLERIPQIKKDMLGPDNIRKELIADAVKRKYEPVDKTLKTVSMGRADITDTEAANVAKAMKVSLDEVMQRAKVLNITVTGDTARDTALYDRYYKKRPVDYDDFSPHENALDFFGAASFYEFLYDADTAREARNYSCEVLSGTAAERKKKYIKSDAESGQGSKLCQACINAFESDETKKKYDDYLDYVVRKRILDAARAAAKISGRLLEGQAEEVVASLTAVFKDRELSERLLVSFCEVEAIVLDFKKADPKEYKVCRCGKINDVTGGRRVCEACGLPLVIKCPRCGTENDANVKVCSCGFNFGNIDKAEALCGQADAAMKRLDLDSAEADLDAAEALWSGSERVKQLRAALKSRRERGGGRVKKVRSLMSEKKYHAASELLKAIKRSFPEFRDEEMETVINQSLGRALGLTARARAARKESEVLRLCGEAYEICNDVPGAKELLMRFPPTAPDEVNVIADVYGRSNTVSWKSDNTASGVSYRVVRKLNARPMNAADGMEIARTDMLVCTDRGIEPGECYYYAVFSERAGVFSEGAYTDEPTVNLFELKNVRTASGDGSVSLSWDTLPESASAVVFRIENGTEHEIAETRNNGYVDGGLENDRQYKYKVVLRYNVNGNLMLTKGVSDLTGVPTCPPLPVDMLTVRPISDGEFTASWKYQGDASIRLYGTTESMPYEYGQIVPLASLESSMQLIQTVPAASREQDEKTVKFSYLSEKVLNITAAVIKAGSAVIGDTARARRGGNVRIKSVNEITGRIHILFEPPKGAVGYVVLYTADRFPKDVRDRNCDRIYIAGKQAESDGALVLNILDKRKFYFSVFAEFISGGGRDYSVGAQYLFDNSEKPGISYKISVQKRLIGGTYVVIGITGTSQSFELPELLVGMQTGRVPIFRRSVGELFRIPAQQVNGSATIQFPVPKETPKNTYIRLFVADDEAAEKYVLKSTADSENKIS